MPRGRAWEAAGALLAYVVVSVVWAAPVSLAPAERVFNLGDPLHLAWIMAWDAHQLIRDPLALHDANGFYPHPRSLTFGDHLLPEALLAAPVSWWTGNPVLASNLGLLLALALSAWSMYLLVRHLAGSGRAGFLAGLLYAFNGFTQQELPRIHVVSIQWWPLALLCLDRFVIQPTRGRAFLLGAALLLQSLSGSYYLVYTALFAPLWLLLAYLGAGRRPRLGELGLLLEAALPAVAIAAAVLWPYPGTLRQLGFEKSVAGGADLLHYLRPSAHNWLWGQTPWAWAQRAETPHFPGLVGLVAVAAGAVALFRGRISGGARTMGWIGLTTAACGLWLSLGPQVECGGVRLGSGPFLWLRSHVPLLRGMAGPERAGVLVLLGGATLAGIGFSRAMARWRGPVATGAFLCLCVLAPVEQWNRPRRTEIVPTGADLPEVYRWLAQDSRGPLLELPLYPEKSKTLWALYLYTSTAHWRPVPIGRSAFYPPGHDYLAWSVRDFPDGGSVRVLQELGIHTLVVHPLLWPEGQRADFLARLESMPGVRLRRQFPGIPPARFGRLGWGDERVYVLDPVGSPLSTPCAPASEIPRVDWTFSSTGITRPENVADGDRRTAWFTATPQRPRDHLEISLPQEETVAAVVLDLGYPYDEFPRDLRLLARSTTGPWESLPYADGGEERWETIERLLTDPLKASLVFRVPSRRLQRLRLVIRAAGADEAWPPWTIPELRLYRECRTPE